MIIGENIRLLREEDKEFLKAKYDKELPDWNVGLELNVERSVATRKRQKLIENIARWETSMH